jgi:hypothetical protein
MELTDIKGDKIDIGDKVIATTDSYLMEGFIDKFCNNTIRVRITKCPAYPNWKGHRYINKNLISKKLYKL